MRAGVEERVCLLNVDPLKVSDKCLQKSWAAHMELQRAEGIRFLVPDPGDLGLVRAERATVVPTAWPSPASTLTRSLPHVDKILASFWNSGTVNYFLAQIGQPELDFQCFTKLMWQCLGQFASTSSSILGKQQIHRILKTLSTLSNTFKCSLCDSHSMTLWALLLISIISCYKYTLINIFICKSLFRPLIISLV